MSGYSLGPRAVYAAQQDSVYLDRSVWTAWFYVHLLDVLKNGTWREYSTEAFGRPCRFDDLCDFLVHEDGLRWRSVDETLGMMELVRDCPKQLEPERDAPADETLQVYARQTLAALAEQGVTRTAPATRVANAALAGGLGIRPAAGPPPKEERTNGEIITIKDTGKGTSAAYLAARLKKAGRDDLLEQIGPGKQHRSVRSAAIEAGIICPVPTIRLVDDVEKVADNICRHLTIEQQVALATAIAQRVRDGPPASA